MIATHAADGQRKAPTWIFAGDSSPPTVAGNVDEMFEGLEVAWRQRDAFLPRITRDVVFEPYFDHPRFTHLLARMNLRV